MTSANLKLPEPEIDHENPWDGDLIGREEIAERLTRIVETPGECLRISLHGEWGSGKTWLLRRWAQDLRNRGFRAIYYNAWEDDFCPDPLLGMLGQMYQELEPDHTFQITMQEVAGVLQKLLAATAREAVRMTTGVDTGNFEEILSKDNILSEYRQETATREELKDRLESAAGKVIQETGKPLTFIIDELDRCRPLYAVELLERVKHIMEIPGIVFMLGINRDQLCRSIRHVNGEINASEYLERFFDFEFNLPDADLRRFCVTEMARTGAAEFLRNMDPNTMHRILDRPPITTMNICMPAIAEAFQMSLREIQQWVRIITLATKVTGERELQEFHFLEALPVIKIKNPSMYQGFRQGKTKSIEIIRYMEGRIDERPQSHTDPASSLLEKELAAIEITLILINRMKDQETADQLKLVEEGKDPTKPELLSERIRKNRPGTVSLTQVMSRNLFNGNPPLIDKILGIIDLHNMPEV